MLAPLRAGSHAALRQLQLQTFTGHRVVEAYDAFLLNAQCLAQEPRIDGCKAFSATAAGLAKRALCCGR
jgi:hypothetical protein